MKFIFNGLSYCTALAHSHTDKLYNINTLSFTFVIENRHVLTIIPAPPPLLLLAAWVAFIVQMSVCLSVVHPSCQIPRAGPASYLSKRTKLLHL